MFAISVRAAPYGEITIIVEEKNVVPKLPEEYHDRKIRQKRIKNNSG
jgi:hypothetical protein